MLLFILEGEFMVKRKEQLNEKDSSSLKISKKLNDDLENKSKSKINKDSKVRKNYNKKINNKTKDIVDNNLKKKKKEKKLVNSKLKRIENKFSLDILDILIIIIITAIISCVISGVILNYQFKKSSTLYGGKITTDENINEFLETYSEVVDNYYEEVDEKAMVEAAIEGMLNFLEDNYSIYLDEDQTDSLSQMLDSTYDGIGIVTVDNIVYEVYKNSPADKVGIKVDDEIIKINGIEVNTDNSQVIADSIKENKDKENEIVIKRDKEELTFNVKTATITIPVTSTDIIKSKDKKIGYLSLSSFSFKSFEEFQESLMSLEKENINSLIIDLRNNTGGYLDSAFNIASLFLEKGKVVYSLENKNKVTAYKDETNDKREYSIVVLVNKTTASAAEILTSALHDSYGAKVVGNTTYGKGKVQTMMYYEDTMMKYTSAKWLRPNGECIDEIGIIPDYEVDVKYDNNTVYDTQLDKAIELLS